jgi:site-specific DNA-methyltransferase (adenine-specific)
MTWKIIHGNNLDVLLTLEDNSVDSIITDPPYELGFMGKKWDSSGIAYSVELWQQCLRVLKPGGHLLAFSGSRTYHRMVVSIEDAGFEIRDMISWISNKTFPKSLNIGKAIDKAAGVQLKIIGKLKNPAKNKVGGNSLNMSAKGMPQFALETAPATPEAQKWEGWGTALKPTVEPVVMARKPLEGTVAANVLKWGTGGLNIDGSRIGMTAEDEKKSFNNCKPQGYEAKENIYDIGNKVIATEQNTQGRWPANVILDEYAAKIVDEQSGQLKGGTWNNTAGARHFENQGKPTKYETKATDKTAGGASRFFFVARASKKDKNEGLEDLQTKATNTRAGDVNAIMNPNGTLPRQNFHPTVKPTTLMEYLIKLVTPPGGTVLDPFAGSGSTGKAAILNGFDFIGIELTAEYLPIINGRLEHAEKERKKKEAEKVLKQFEGLF